MLEAYGHLQRLERRKAALQELPVAQLTALTANLNRDSKKSPKPFSAHDFAIFQERKEVQSQFPPEVAAIALELRHEGCVPELLLTVWPELVRCATSSAKVPPVRAFRSDDDAVWVLAPVWEGQNCRGGLVLVRGRIHGTVVIRDIDRPLLSYRLRVPQRPGYGWIEAGLLLVAGTEN